MTFTQDLILQLCAAGLVGLLLGLIASGINLNIKFRKQLEAVQQYHQQQLTELKETLIESKQQLAAHKTELELAHQEQLQAQRQLGELEQMRIQLQHSQAQLSHWQQKAQEAAHSANQFEMQLESQAARFKQAQVSSDEKIALLEAAEQRLQIQFENLANKIFEQKQEKFTQSSKAGLDALLSPLKEQIEGFKRQVSDQYVKEGQERASLKTEILSLKELNQQITQDAAALTKALKGDNKQQGNWGEVVLERILTESGLREGHEFDTQLGLKNDAGKAYQPDVVVHLPNDKDIVIDSKVSLAHYERYFNEQEDEISRQSHLFAHLNSMKTHIKELGKKNYQDLNGIRTLDYILMFVPIESAFLLAVDKAPEIIKLALDNNIMIVSPTNLLVALRTVNNIWQYEYQNQNAQKIASNAAKLYDKFHGFVQDLDRIGKGIESVQKNYDLAMGKLSTGKGNLVRQIEQFRTLGVQSNKRLDNALIEKANEHDELDEQGEEEKAETDFKSIVKNSSKDKSNDNSKSE